MREKSLLGVELSEKLNKLKKDMAGSQPVYQQMNGIISFINDQRNLNPFLIMANQKGRYVFKRDLSRIDDHAVASPEVLEETSRIYKEFFQSIVKAIDFMRPNFEEALNKVSG